MNRLATQLSNQPGSGFFHCSGGNASRRLRTALKMRMATSPTGSP